ncbi:hypothetical protein FACS1894161_0900 [Spirochaetia bacterium]|nr:hypothetical protein FACS1894161_0900 [Spirochaetia bacterium]
MGEDTVDDREIDDLREIYGEMDINGRKKMFQAARQFLNVQNVLKEEVQEKKELIEFGKGLCELREV